MKHGAKTLSVAIAFSKKRFFLVKMHFYKQCANKLLALQSSEVNEDLAVQYEATNLQPGARNQQI